jgi:hypothetical protein
MVNNRIYSSQFYFYLIARFIFMLKAQVGIANLYQLHSFDIQYHPSISVLLTLVAFSILHMVVEEDIGLVGHMAVAAVAAVDIAGIRLDHSLVVADHTAVEVVAHIHNPLAEEDLENTLAAGHIDLDMAVAHIVVTVAVPSMGFLHILAVVVLHTAVVAVAAAAAVHIHTAAEEAAGHNPVKDLDHHTQVGSVQMIPGYLRMAMAHLQS